MKKFFKHIKIHSEITHGTCPNCSELTALVSVTKDLYRCVTCGFDLEQKITGKTKAIIVVHMLGVPIRLKEIKEIADKHNIPLIEDTAWGCGGFYDGTPLGTYGDIGTYSFDFAKTMTTGEGGMCTTNNQELANMMCRYRSHGITRDTNLMLNKNEGPWYYEQLALIYRKNKDLLKEHAILERFESQRHAPGRKPETLMARLAKVRESLQAP